MQAANDDVNHVAVRKIGCFRKRVAAYRPTSKELIVILKQLDNEKNGRKGYASFKAFMGDVFALTTTGPAGLEQHKRLALELKSPEDFAQVSAETVLNIFSSVPNEVDNLYEYIVRSILAKKLLHMYELTPEINKLISDISAFGFSHVAHLMPQLFCLNSEYNKLRKQFAQYSPEIIKVIADTNVTNLLQQFVQNLNANELNDFVKKSASQKHQFRIEAAEKFNGVKLNDGKGTQIPPKTMITIRLPNSELEEKCSPNYLATRDPAFFSGGPRMCPGARVAKVMFQSIIATLLNFYELKPTKDGWNFVEAPPKNYFRFLKKAN